MVAGLGISVREGTDEAVLEDLDDVLPKEGVVDGGTLVLVDSTLLAELFKGANAMGWSLAAATSSLISGAFEDSGFECWSWLTMYAGLVGVIGRSCLALEGREAVAVGCGVAGLTLIDGDLNPCCANLMCAADSASNASECVTSSCLIVWSLLISVERRTLCSGETFLVGSVRSRLFGWGLK